MTGATAWFAAGLAAGGAAVALLGRRRRGGSPPRGADPALLPEPALRWLAAARGARGVWVLEAGGSDGEGPVPIRWQRVIADPALEGGALAGVETRLEALRARPASGAERVEEGTLLYGSAAGVAAALLLPVGAPHETLQLAGEDLVHLLDGLARRPVLTRATEEGDSPVESLGSIGLRLAYQLERVLSAEVIVAVTVGEEVKVVGTSGRADRRLLDTLAQPASPLFQVARGEAGPLTTIADPLGGIVHDRRNHLAPAIILPIKRGEESVGAIAFWTDDDGAPIGPVSAEVQEAMRNAAPRIVRARKLEELNRAAITDPLTGLRNRRGLDEAMHRVGINTGSLIYADFDKFKLLNDTLGHPAGDAALVHFSRLVHDIVRGGDTAARVGGEEFGIWLPGAPLTEGSRVAERIRIRLGTAPWDWQGRSWPLSASFGVAGLPETTRSLDNLAALADQALMAAKQGGRNRVELAPTRG